MLFFSQNNMALSQLVEQAHRFSNHLKSKDVLGLQGPLGSGKTTFCQAILEKQGIPKNTIRGSPTFQIVHDYDHIIHIDLYRITSIEELMHRGILHTIWNTDSILLIEWIDLLPDLVLSLKRIKRIFTIQIEINSHITRNISIECSPLAEQNLDNKSAED